jgi:DNA topoisomerase IA
LLFMGIFLVIVESPVKVCIIFCFFGDDYRVEVSIGYIRDLATRASDLSLS